MLGKMSKEDHFSKSKEAGYTRRLRYESCVCVLEKSVQCESRNHNSMLLGNMF